MITELDCHRIIVLHLIECISTETIMRRGRHIILYYYLYVFICIGYITCNIIVKNSNV